MSSKINPSILNFDSKIAIKIGSLFFSKKFVLLNVNEGEHLGHKNMQEISIIVSEYFKDRPFACICNKTTSYSVNPIAYECLNENKNIKCIAIAKKNTKGFDLDVEKHFIKKPIEVFETIEEASNWIDIVV